MSAASPSASTIQQAETTAETANVNHPAAAATDSNDNNASPSFRLITETELQNPSTISLSRLDPNSSKPLATLNPSAKGWSRRPLGDTRLYSGLLCGGGLFRNKRWEYYGVMTPSHVIGITVSSLDYAGVNQLFIYSRDSESESPLAGGAVLSREVVAPLAWGVTLPETYGSDSVASFMSKELSISIQESSTEIDKVTHITAQCMCSTNQGQGEGKEKKEIKVSLDLTLSRPKDSDALHVVVPFNESTNTDCNRFQYTIKEPAIPVSAGQLIIDGTVHPLSSTSTGGFAVLDHGRGRWPYSMVWNWAAGSGISLTTGRRVGFSIGGKWTEGSGSTENCIILDGHLIKISEELRWEYDTGNWMAPWRISGRDLELKFTPFSERVAKTNLLVLAGETHQLFGRWEGVFRTSSCEGGEISLDGLEGWAEEARNRW